MGATKQDAKKFLVFSAAILVLFIVPSAFAINQLLPLHGRVTSSGSSLSSGDLQVIIYDASTLGNIVYNSGSDFNGSVQRGIVDVMLGSTTQVLDLNYGTYYYMDINVNGVNLDFNGVDRKKFESNRGDDLNVNSLGSVTSVASRRLYLASDGNVGIGTSSPNGKLVVVTAANDRALVVNDISGNVGVATLSTAPAYSLDVNGTFRVQTVSAVASLFTATDGNVGIRTITPLARLQVLGAAGDTNLLSVNLSTGAPGLVVRSDGNVGIVTTPASTWRLDVSGNTRLTGYTRHTGTSNLVGDLNVAITAGTGAPALFVSGTDGNVGVSTATPLARLAVLGVAGDANLLSVNLSTGAPALVVRASDGNVGIGTNNPIRTLSVVGDVNVFGTVYATALVPSNQWAVSGTNIYYTTGNVGANTTVPNNKLTVVGDLNVVASNSATPSLFVTLDGNVGINSVISKNKLLLIGDLNVLTSATATPSLFVSSTDGNIGIAGTAASTWRLDVSGNTRLTGYTRHTGTSNLVGDLNVAITAGTGAPALFVSGTDRNVSVNNVFGTNKLTLVGDLNVTPAGTGSPALFVHPTDGNIGIATTPASTWRLDVSGYTRFSSGDVNVQGNKLIVQDVNRLGKSYVRESPASNACMGLATLGSTLPAPVTGSAVTVTTTCITANSRVFLTRDSNGEIGTQGGSGAGPLYFNGSRIAGISFDINSSFVNDANKVAWLIIEPA